MDIIFAVFLLEQKRLKSVSMLVDSGLGEVTDLLSPEKMSVSRDDRGKAWALLVLTSQSQPPSVS